MAAKKLGLKEVPILLVEHLTEAQKRAYIIADNRLALAGAGVAGHLGTRSLMMLKDKYGFKDYER